MKVYAITRRGGWESPEQLEAAAQRSTAVGEERPDEVRWIRSYILQEEDGRLGSVCIYEGADADAVRRHARDAELPCDEVVPVADTVVVREDPVKAA